MGRQSRLVTWLAALLAGCMLLSVLMLVTVLDEEPPRPSGAGVLELQQQVVGMPAGRPAGGPASGDASAMRVRGAGRLKVAFAVTITKDGPYLDGAAVLKHSIDRSGSRHEVEVVAIVHPEVQETRPALRKLGIRIVEFDAPITSAEIEGKHLRETIDKSGCCGALELLKLRGYELTEYDRVLLLDMDTLIVKNLDHLFEIDKEIVLTYDHAMDNKNSPAPPAQGGFLLIKPSKQTFQRMIDIVREGDFRPGTGWGGTGIGWCWGGQTVQGLVSYYYNMVEPDKKHLLDHCLYNAMVSTRDCESTPFDSVYSIHYTVCQKPWDCRPSDKPLCVRMVKEWWNVRRSLERSMGLPESTIDGCRSRHREYTSIPLL